ncbi:MAG: hypothetical protein HYZ13_14165 [Acidobacteria bacterium]|nr:hypothetical protein [Acidobacteriota bacterium]
MSSSNRTGWALLLLRVAVGGAAILQGFTALRAAHGAITFANVGHWGLELGVMIAGAFVLVGLWLPITAGALAILLGWPLVHGWLHGAGALSQPDRLFRLLAALASAVGGAGKWGMGK